MLSESRIADERLKEMLQGYQDIGYGDTAAALRELLALREQNRWIPVTEKLPEPWMRVEWILRGDKSDPVFGFILNTPTPLVRWLGSDSVDTPLSEFTHWRPLPAPPLEG